MWIDRQSKMWPILATILGTIITTMIQVGPEAAEQNLCQWIQAVSSSATDKCLHGFPIAIIEFAAYGLMVGGLIWLFWPAIEPRIPQKLRKFLGPAGPPQLTAETVAAPAGPITILELAEIADRDFGWKLTSDHPSSGWENWDFKDGLQHAANEGILQFEGKDFGRHEPSTNPFVRRSRLFTSVNREDWAKHLLQIIIPYDSFRETNGNFDNQIGCFESTPHYYDIRISDRPAALHWLKTTGPKIKGESERLHHEVEARRAQNPREPFADTGQGIEIKDVPREVS